MSDLTATIICCISLVVSVVCMPSLWRQPDPWIRRLLWSVIILVPVVGPIAYGGFYSLPHEHHESSPYAHRFWH